MTTLNAKPTSFRKDINGLRAWAVVAVILFHFGISGFEGGFVGVDIFFVISGFLMTGIIISGLEKPGSDKNFSLLNFYVARARRIIPALLVLCLFLMILGWFWLPAVDYKALGEHIFSALGFFSNIQFWLESGYFDASSFNKWLLHTWSLSVEWQFYIILPLLLLVLWKIHPNRNFITSIILLGFMLSLSLSIFLSPIKPNPSFYLLPTRAWEMLAGSLVLLLVEKVPLNVKQSKALEIAGFILLVYSILFLTSSNTWPGSLAIVPVLGTVLILFSNRPQSLFTTTKSAQFLGKISYSLYLWHWPLVVALHYAGLQDNYWAISIALLLTLVLGYTSYQLIENPARSYLYKFSLAPSVIGFTLIILTVALPSLAINNKDGIPHDRLSEQIEKTFAEATNKNPSMIKCHVSDLTRVPECTYGGAELGAIVIGDSHAASLVRSIEKSLSSKEQHVLDWTLSNCPTISDIKDKSSKKFKCKEFISHILQSEKLTNNHVPIIIINRLSASLEGANEPDRVSEIKKPNLYINNPHSTRNDIFYQEMSDGIVKTACQLAKSHPVYMMRPIPELKLHVPNTMGRNLLLFNKEIRVSISRDEYSQRHQKAIATQDRAAAQCGIKILDPLPYLCDDNHCYGDKDGIPLYYDDDHLSERGGQLLIPMLKNIFVGRT